MYDAGDELDTVTPEEVRIRWVDMMRSGLWEQSVGYLRQGHGHSYKYSALGLLCKCLVEMGLDDMNREEWGRVAPPERSCMWADLNCDADDDGMAIGGEAELIETMNDYGMPLHFIADLIDGAPVAIDLYKLGE